MSLQAHELRRNFALMFFLFYIFITTKYVTDILYLYISLKVDIIGFYNLFLYSQTSKPLHKWAFLRSEQLFWALIIFWPYIWKLKIKIRKCVCKMISLQFLSSFLFYQLNLQVWHFFVINKINNLFKLVKTNIDLASWICCK